MKKIIIIILSIFCIHNIFGQRDAEKMLVKATKFAVVENYLYEYKEFSQKYVKVESFQWNEFDHNADPRNAIPDKISITTFFSISPIFAGEEILKNEAFFKTTIQFIYGDDVSGDNVLNPFTGEEIPILAGSFTSKDIIKMFNEHKNGKTGLRFTSNDFLLKEYLLKNNVSFMDENEDTYKYLGRIVIRTYVGSSKEKLNVMAETIVNPMDFYRY